MQSTKRFFLHTSFGSAVLGGTVVAIFCAIAISAGLIDADNDGSQSAIAQPPLTKPASDESGETGLTVSQIYDKDSEGVVFIESQVSQQVQTPFGFPQEQQGSATGSGFVIDTEGHILTNAHVVEGASKITVTLGDDDPVTAMVIGKDTSNDIALLQVDVDSSKLHPLALGDSSKVGVGDPVVAIGNPFGLDRTVTSGIISALQRHISAPNGFSIDDVLQTDASINPGNSGGPLIDANGAVIGINSQIETGGGEGSVGIGFSEPINTAKDIVKQLLEDGQVEHAYLGIEGGDLSPQLASALNLPTDKGVLVQEVLKGGPAQKAGIHGGDTQATVGGQQILLGGDIIVAVDGKDVTSMEEVSSAVDDHKPGDELTLTLLRDGNRTDVTVTLGNRPNQINNTSTPLGQ